MVNTLDNFKIFRLIILLDHLHTPVKFSTEDDFAIPDMCWLLLDEYMPEYIKERKISQKLFIK